MIRGEASEVYRMAQDLSTVGFKMIPNLRLAMGEAGEALAKTWAANAAETSGTHGKHYPKSIDSELTFSVQSVTVEAGPNRTKRQGGMGPGFEFGSKNQPPHLDGLHAMDTVAPLAEELVASVVGGTFVANTPATKTLQEYTTKAGKTRLATASQIANWTRGSR